VCQSQALSCASLTEPDRPSLSPDMLQPDELFTLLGAISHAVHSGTDRTTRGVERPAK
jgi:hypothetical protein